MSPRSPTTGRCPSKKAGNKAGKVSSVEGVYKDGEKKSIICESAPFSGNYKAENERLKSLQEAREAAQRRTSFPASPKQK